MWVLALATLVNRLGSMALPFLVLYLTKHLGFSPPYAGLLFALYGAGSLIASPVAGRLCDRIGARRLLWASLALTGLSLLLYPLATTPPSIALATLAFSLTNESFRPASLVMVGELVAPAQRKQAFALSRLAINLGMSVGPALAGLLATIWFPVIFLVDGATALLSAAILFFSFGRAGAPPPSRRAEASAAEDNASPRRALSDRPFLLFLLASFVIGTIFFQLEAAEPLYIVRDLHLSERSFGLLFTVNTTLILTLEVPLNAATARWSHPRTLSLGALLCGVGVGAIVFAQGFWTAAISVAIWTFGEMLLFPAMAAYVADVSPKGRGGEYMGLYSTAFGLAFTIGPGLGTWVLQRFGGVVLWSGVFVVSVAAAGMMAAVPAGKAAHHG